MLTFIYILFEDGGAGKGDPLQLTTKKDPVQGLLHCAAKASEMSKWKAYVLQEKARPATSDLELFSPPFKGYPLHVSHWQLGHGPPTFTHAR